MHNIISSENLVALLKCEPLHPNQIWYIYAFRAVRFYSVTQGTSVPMTPARLYGQQTSTDTSWHCRSWPSSLESRPRTGSRVFCSDSSQCLPSGSERQGSTNSTSTPTSHTTLFGNTDKTTYFADDWSKPLDLMG